jgi:amino acid adenylation domain-containing protein
MTSTAKPAVAPHTGAGLVLDAVNRWAARLPAATAVTAPDGDLTFVELRDTVSTLAADLLAAGAAPGVQVGIAFGRSALTVPALLAVWHTGATAVPLDDRHPADRLAYIVGDAEVQLLLGELPASVPTPLVRKVERTVGRTGHTQAATPGPTDCAYLVYTSGTTGRPKGVQVGYAALGAFLSAISTLGLTPGGVGFNPLSPAFDGWFWCTLLYLLHGQGVAIVDTAGAGGADLAGAIAAVAPRTVCLSPSLYAACPDDMPSVDVLVVAGEPCPPALADRFLTRHRVLNVYGPTEATIAATWADSAAGDDVRTIGRPIPGYHAYVLDESGAAVPAGESGELCIGGPGVALGYRNLPELTEAKFVPDPAGGRMYRTGDHVRLLPDGQLDFLGRLDDQVKIRAFRVELGAVDHTAAGAEEVRAAAAFVLRSGDALGLAVVPEAGVEEAAAVTAALGRCQHLLPDYMVPVVVEPLTELPVTPHGKADRAALAELVAGRQEEGRPPTTERERQVCEVWSSVLPRPVYDVDANFFAAGGHSLLASRAVVALRKVTGLRLSIKDLLTHPTPAELARKLDRLAEDAR